MHNSNNDCGCTEKTTTYNNCNKCAPEVPCDCPVIDLSTNCSLYKGDDIKCGEVVIVPKNTILTDALSNIVSYMCQRFSELMQYFRLINVGTGSELYAGDTLIGQKKIRTLVSADSFINIAQTTDEISIGIDDETLSDFITSEQNNFVRYLVIPPNALPSNYTEQDICNYILSLPAGQRTIQSTDSKWNILIGYLPG